MSIINIRTRKFSYHVRVVSFSLFLIPSIMYVILLISEFHTKFFLSQNNYTSKMEAYCVHYAQTTKFYNMGVAQKYHFLAITEELVNMFHQT